MRPTRAARSGVAGLAFLGIVVGIAEIAGARRLAGATGFGGHAGKVRLAGVRQLVAGAALLRSKDPRPWLWLRAGGNAIRLAVLATRLDGPRRGGAAMAMSAVAIAAVLDIVCARSLRRPPGAGGDVAAEARGGRDDDGSGAQAPSDSLAARRAAAGWPGDPQVDEDPEPRRRLRAGVGGAGGGRS